MAHTQPLLRLSIAVPGGCKQLLMFEGESIDHLAATFVEDNSLPHAAVPLLVAQLQAEAQVARSKLAQRGDTLRPRVKEAPQRQPSPVVGIATSPIYAESPSGGMLLHDGGGSVSVGSMGDALSASELAAGTSAAAGTRRPGPVEVPDAAAIAAPSLLSASEPRLLAQDAVARELQFNAVRAAAAEAARAAAAAGSSTAKAASAASKRRAQRRKAQRPQVQPPVYARLIRDTAARAEAAPAASPSAAALGVRAEPGQDPAAAALQLRVQQPGTAAPPAVGGRGPVWRQGAPPRFAELTAAAAAKAAGTRTSHDIATAEASAAATAAAAAPWTCSRCSAVHSGSEPLCTAPLKWGRLWQHRVSGQLRGDREQAHSAAHSDNTHTQSEALPHFAFPPLSSVLRGESPPPQQPQAPHSAGDPDGCAGTSSGDQQQPHTAAGGEAWLRVCGASKPPVAHTPAVSAPGDAAARAALTAAAAARHAQAQARVAALVEENAAARLAECTFAPHVGARSAALAAAKVRGASLLQRLALPAPAQPPALPPPARADQLAPAGGATVCSHSSAARSTSRGGGGGGTGSTRAPLTNRGATGRGKGASAGSVCSALFEDASARRARRQAATAAADAAAAAPVRVRGAGVAANEQLARAAVTAAAGDLFGALRCTNMLSLPQRQQWQAAAAAGDAPALAALLEAGQDAAAAAGVPPDALPPTAGDEALWVDGVAARLRSVAARGAAAGRELPAFVRGVAAALAADAAAALGQSRAADTWGAALGQLRRLKTAPPQPLPSAQPTPAPAAPSAMRPPGTLQLRAAPPAPRAPAAAANEEDDEAPLPVEATFVPAVNPRSAAMVAAARRGAPPRPVHERLLAAGAQYRRRAAAAAALSTAADAPGDTKPLQQKRPPQVERPAPAPDAPAAPQEHAPEGGLDALQHFDVAALLALTAQ